MLDRDHITALLTELGQELHAAGLRGEMFLVGGAAMALVHSTRRATRDVDAAFEPKMAIYHAARRVGNRHDLGDDWLNDAAKAFMPGDDPHATVYFDHPGLRVRVASPRYLFAMKAMAARVERDSDDLRELYALSGFESVNAALDHVVATYPYLPLAPKVQYLLEEALKGDQRDG